MVMEVTVELEEEDEDDPLGEEEEVVAELGTFTVNEMHISKDKDETCHILHVSVVTNKDTMHPIVLIINH